MRLCEQEQSGVLDVLALVCFLAANVGCCRSSARECCMDNRCKETINRNRRKGSHCVGESVLWDRSRWFRQLTTKSWLTTLVLKHRSVFFCPCALRVFCVFSVSLCAILTIVCCNTNTCESCNGHRYHFHIVLEPHPNPCAGTTNRFKELDNLLDHSADAVFAPLAQRELDRRPTTPRAMKEVSA